MKLEQDKEKERMFTDAFVERTGGYDTYDEDLSQLLTSLNISKSSKETLVLDVGCGTGKCSIPLAKLGYKVIGVDISDKAIEIALKKAEKAKLDITFRVEDIEDLSFENDTFDLVFCGGVLHHFPDLKKIESEMHRVLKEKGRLCAYEPNRSNPITYFFFTFVMNSRRLFNLEYIENKFSVNERALCVKELEESLRQAGFSDFYFDSINIRNINDNSQKFKGKLRNLIYSLNEKVLPPLYKGSHIVLSCVKDGHSHKNALTK